MQLHGSACRSISDQILSESFGSSVQRFEQKILPVAGPRHGTGSTAPPGFLTAHERICLVLLRSRSDTVRRIHCVRPKHQYDGSGRLPEPCHRQDPSSIANPSASGKPCAFLLWPQVQAMCLPVSAASASLAPPLAAYAPFTWQQEPCPARCQDESRWKQTVEC